MKFNHKRLSARLLLTLPCLAVTAPAAILVNLDASSLDEGAVSAWANTGTLPGNFTAAGAPIVGTVGQLKCVSLGGNADYFVGPLAPDSISGVNPTRSVEVWAYNPTVSDEETLVAWGHRGGPDGTNFSFNYGMNASYGAVGHWGGGPDLGWNNAGGAPAAGAWHYLVYTYDGGGAAGAGTTRVYANGVLQNSEFHGNLNTHLGQAILIGGQNQSAGVPGGFNGGLSVARVRIHDTLLTDAQIAAKYAEELPLLFPKAFLASTRVTSTQEFCFNIQDQAPSSVTVPSSFTVTPQGERAGWRVEGGDGPFTGSLTSPPIAVSATGTVSFTLRHRYNFEGNGTPTEAYDGGVVQVSINGGEFTTVPDADFTENSYFDSPIIGTGPLNGQPAFNGNSPGFAAGTLINSSATIAGLVQGDTVRIRCLGAWDEFFTPAGIDWEVAGLTVRAGTTTLFDQNFAGGDGGFTQTSTAGGGTWNFINGTAPVIGTPVITKTGGVTTICVPITWTPGATYPFTIRGKDTANADLVYTPTVAAPSLPLAPSRTWPVCLPGPMGTAGRWGVRTFLNSGIVAAEDLNAMLTFLDNSADRTPTLTPTNVVDTQEPNLNFVDPATNGGVYGVIGCPRPFPGEALSTSTNGGTARDDNHVISVAHGTITITEASDYTFNLRGDDGFMFRIKRAEGGAPPTFAAVVTGQVDTAQRNIVFFPAGTGDANVRAVTYLTPGTYKLEYATWEGGGGFWYQVSAAKGFFLADSDTTDWRAVGYVSNRTTPIPYPSMVGDWTVTSTLPGGLTQVDIAGANAAVDAAFAAEPVAAVSLWPQINFTDPGFGGTGRIAGDVPWPRNTEADDNRYAMRTAGTLRIPESGEYLIGFQGDDGTELTVGGTHAGFSALTENATGAGVIGRANSPVLNSGSIGAAGHSSPNTSVFFGRSGALAGSTDTAIGVDAAAGNKAVIPFSAALNPATGTGEAAPFTVECWAKPASLTGGAQAVVNSMIAGANQNPGNANDRSGYVLRLNNGDWQFYLGLENGGAFYEIAAAPGAAQAGVWQHVAGVYTGTALKIFVNGELVSTTTTVGPFKANFAAPLLLGRRGFGDWRYNGDIDEVAVYPTALSDADILARYANGTNAARTTPYETLVATGSPTGYWRLNETLQPRVNLGTITTDVPTGDSSTVGRIFLAAGDYPITATFWEDGGGSYFEIFATRDVPGGCVPVRPLRNGGFPSIPDSSGLALIDTPVPPAPVVQGNLVSNPNGALSISFSSVATGVYQLEQSANLLNWQALSKVEATGSSTTITGTAGGSFSYDPAFPTRYFRVKAVP